MKIYFFLSILLLTSTCQAQSLSGSYRYKSEDFSGSRTITFSKNSFNEKTTNDMTLSIGNGTYTIKNNQLLLKYKKVSNQDTSRYEISTSRELKASTTIDLQTFDSEGIKMPAVYGFSDYQDKPISHTVTNSDGIGFMSIYNYKSIGYFNIGYIGYHQVSIPIKNIIKKNKDCGLFNATNKLLRRT